LPTIKQRLNDAIVRLIDQGVVYFGCGGALGFHTLAGFTVLGFKEKFKAVKLVMVLPCHNQDERWTQKDKAAYHELIAAADKTVYVSEQYFDGCMKKRNIHLVEISDYCIAYLKHDRSGTGQTVRLAKERGLTVCNLFLR